MLILPNRFLSLQILRMGKTHRFVFTVHFKATTWSRKRRIIIDFTVRSNLLAVQHIFSQIEQLLKGNYNKCGHVLPLSHLICFQLCVFVCVVQQSVSVSGFCVFSHWNFTASMWKPTHTPMILFHFNFMPHILAGLKTSHQTYELKTVPHVKIIPWPKENTWLHWKNGDKLKSIGS